MSIVSFVKNLFQKKDFQQKVEAERKFQKSMQKYLDDPTAHNTDPNLECSNFRAFMLVWHYVLPYQFYIFIAIGMIMAGSSIDGYLIYQIKFIVDQGGGILDRIKLTDFAIVLIILMTLRAIMNFLSQLFFNRSNQGLVVSLGEKVFAKIASMPQAFFDVHGHGAIISKIQYGVNAMSGASGSILLSFSRDGSTVIAFLVVMFKANWVISSVIFLLLPTIYLSLKLVKMAITMVSKGQMNASEVQIKYLNDMVKGHQVVNLYNAQDFEHYRYFQSIDNIRKGSEKGIIVSNFGHSFIQFVASLLLASIILLSAYAKYLHIPQISPGDFIVIFTSMFGLLKPLRNLTNMVTGFIASLTAAKSILGLLAIDGEEDTGTLTEKEVDFTKDIEYRHVYFHYPTRPDTAILRNFNLKIEAGKTYAFIGKSGGGKSTIVSLLPRTYDVDDLSVDAKGNPRPNPPESGIFIDNVNIKDISLKSLRDNVSVVSQNVYLFDDTIYNNIVYCDVGKYTHEEVMQAAKLAHVLDFAKELPDGIDTLIGSDGTRLSGGQRQRVSIARAILRKKPILILDEATSALDNESEAFIQNSLAELQKGKTVLVIAHRLSTIENADQILVINDGKIVERGVHKELIENPQGEYFKLYYRDFTGMDSDEDLDEFISKSIAEKELQEIVDEEERQLNKKINLFKKQPKDAFISSNAEILAQYKAEKAALSKFKSDLEMMQYNLAPQPRIQTPPYLTPKLKK